MLHDSELQRQYAYSFFFILILWFALGLLKKGTPKLTNRVFWPKWGSIINSFQNNRLFLNSGLKYLICVNMNQIGPLLFALAIRSIVRTSWHTTRHILNHWFELRGPNSGYSRRKLKINLLQSLYIFFILFQYLRQ